MFERNKFKKKIYEYWTYKSKDAYVRPLSNAFVMACVQRKRVSLRAHTHRPGIWLHYITWFSIISRSFLWKFQFFFYTFQNNQNFFRKNIDIFFCCNDFFLINHVIILPKLTREIFPANILTYPYYWTNTIDWYWSRCPVEHAEHDSRILVKHIIINISNKYVIKKKLY